ncbi:penicillin-binding protein 2 [Marinimicrobium sp. ABcell2]|uniref:peptidoglycan D,D-transpeptidase FtsI family protein n=1 Tax=Marinimicrobium sp. ABcell2 TaxID=3069751 RepID=UPI0027B1989A|nr:penicillin-binding transpeptidase domain-containing protein [Marinimicrobium sp. ABcell2]MDQ2075081.1 penicillin-binding transpeptidase domain-containing protein [Marinimicrobium sp. ABcell2]
MSRAQKLTLPRWRVYLVALVVLALCLALLWRVTSLQVLPHTDRGFQFLQNQGQARTLRTEPISAYRGVITDRNGEPLAVSTPVESLWADPQVLIQAPHRWAELAEALGWDKARLESRLARFASREFMYLRRHLPPHQAEQVLALNIPGVSSQREYRRFYPAGEVTAHLVGFTDIDDRGQEGMELAYDAWLSGESGAKQVLKDLRGNTVKELQLIRAARPGRSLALSIDLRLQYLAHSELKAAVRSHGAIGGSLVIMDVHTGEVLAMTNQPAYNPNDRNRVSATGLRNRALTDLFEPGSTVKPLAVMAAMEAGEFRSDSVIDTSPGHVYVGGHMLLDPANYGALDLPMIIAKSSQVGMTKLALAMEPNIIRSMYGRLGLGQSPGTGFPGEGVGLLPSYSRWHPIQQANFAFGYGLNLSSLQLAQAYGVLATRGLKRPPSLLRLTDVPEPERVVDEALSESIVDMLRLAVSPNGTGHRANLPSYPVAGKTGTVRKVGANGYMDNKHLASFAGFAPADNPRIVAVVVIDEPSETFYFGGQVAAPVFARVAERALRLLQVPPETESLQNLVEQPRRGRPLS